MNFLVSLQSLAWEKDIKIISRMHKLRDDMRDTTKGGHVLCSEVPEKFGAAAQPEIGGMAGLIAGFGKGFETATQLHTAIGTEVVAPLLRLNAKVSGRFVRFGHARAFDLKIGRLCSHSVAIGHRTFTLRSATAFNGCFRTQKSPTASMP